MKQAAAAPSGQQVTITSGKLSATITEVGATLRELSLGDWRVVDGFGSDEMCREGRGQVLAPWPNRLDKGTYTYGKRLGRAALDEPENSNAIHGLVRWRRFEIVKVTTEAVEMRLDSLPEPGFPFQYHLGITYSVSSRGLEVKTVVRNSGDEAMPFGIGFHPYLRLAACEECVADVGAPGEKLEGVGGGGCEVDRWLLGIPARQYFIADERSLPVSVAAVDGTEFDFNGGRKIGSTVLDTCFTGFEPAAGERTLTVSCGLCENAIEVWADDAFNYFMVFTGDTLGTGKARKSVAIEPMTCPPNSFNSKRGIIELGVGESMELVWGIRLTGVNGMDGTNV